MQRLRLILPVMILSLAAPGTGQEGPAAAPPAVPRVSLAKAAALVDLARSAMRVYLTDRTPADRQSIPARLRPLAKSRYAVALTLRSKGGVVARSWQDRRNLARNVIAAALEAMRSPGLPDRVTSEVLDALTVELEILGPQRPVSEAQLGGAIGPGLTGVKFARGIDDSPLLASTAYVLNLTAEQVPRRCLAGLRATSDNISLPLRRTIFAAKHYIGFPDGKTVWLYRGKILFPFEAIDEKMLAATAGRVGAFLVRHQKRSGRYVTPDAGGSRRDHLYATFAMVRLAGRTRRKDFAASVRAAVEFALRQVGRDRDRCRVITARPADELAATGWLLRIMCEVPQNERTTPLRRGLLAAIRHELGDKRRLLARLGNRPGAAWLRGACVAILAWAEAATPGSDDAGRIKTARDVLGQAVPPGIATELWMKRAGIPAGRRRPYAATGPKPARGKLPPALDETGGFGPPGRPPDTAITAWRAIDIAAAIPRLEKLRTPQPAGKAKARLAAARRFCFRMMYHSPYEAYFAKHPGSYVGGVRQTPAGAKVTLRACAAAIEAFLVN